MRTAYLRMHLAIFLWGFTGLLGKLIKLNEGMLVWYRMLISSVVIALILVSRKELPRLSRGEFVRISGIGFLVMLHWIAFYGSIKLANISIAMICLSSVALFASFLEPLINRQKFDPMEILFSGLAITGISSIYFSDPSVSTGVVVGLISSFFSALFSVLNRRIASKHPPLTISLIELAAGAFFLTFLIPVYLWWQPDTVFVPDQMDWIYLIILSVICTVFTWILSLQALRNVSAYTMALALNLEPVYGILLAVLFAGEAAVLNERFLLGAAVIILTVALHTLYKFKKERKTVSKA